VHRRCGTPVAQVRRQETGARESERVAQIAPIRIGGFDQIEFPCATPAFQRALASARVDDRGIKFAIDETVDVVGLGEARDVAIPVLVAALVLRRARDTASISDCKTLSMAAIAQACLDAQAYRWLRHDWRRYVHRGSALEKYYEELERKYRPDQARVPAGNSDGGQWTDEGGGSSSQGGRGGASGSQGEPTAGDGRSDPRVLSDATPDNYYEPGTRLVQNDPEQKYGVNLNEEEKRGGHTIRDHVGKSDDELMSVMQSDRSDGGVVGYVRRRQGAFESVEKANDLVNRTLEANKSVVDRVARGENKRDFITSRFGYVTGREAYRPAPDASPYLRNTYSVGVGIERDARASRGYRVYTAYPRND
jgi:hypothetical protein